MPARARRQFTEECKAEAVTLVRQSGKTIAQVARDLDLTDSALRNWVERSQHAGSPSSELSSTEHKVLQQLRKEVRVLRMERELLKNPPRGTAHLWKEKLLWCYPKFAPEGAAGCAVQGADRQLPSRTCLRAASSAGTVRYLPRQALGLLGANSQEAKSEAAKE